MPAIRTPDCAPTDGGTESLASSRPGGDKTLLTLQGLTLLDEGSADDRWSYPLYTSTTLQPSSSVRSQRNWNEFDGQHVSPLPSPLIRTPQEEYWSPPMMEDSKTDAFFNASPSIPTPKPPASISRSVSTHNASAPPESSQRRQRALSNPLEPNRGAWAPEAQASMVPPRNPLMSEIRPRKERARLPLENKTRPSTASRHIHGPSVNVTDDSLFPLEPAQPSPEDRRERPINEALLDALDHVDEQEDEQTGHVGPYRIVSQLGTGAFSKVLLADAPPRGHVALKMITCDPWTVDKRMRVSWLREAEILKHISHPNIVEFKNAFRTPKHYALVLEAVSGGELFDLLASHQAQISQREWLVRRIFGELASAVHWMHDAHLVHRDIKLENIMVTQRLFATNKELTPSQLAPVPLVKITDFGLARFINEDQLLETRCGSEEYAAPELIMGKKYDGRKTDTWAMGVVLFALTAGQIPFLEHANGTSEQRTLRYVREHAMSAAERDAQNRKAHLLRIAKGDLSWPDNMNDLCEDQHSDMYDPTLRLLTPRSRHTISRFLRRDPKRRADCLELWQDPWFLYGSFTTPEQAHSPAPYDEATVLCVAHEASAQGQYIALPYSPLDPRGMQWTAKYARTSPLHAAPVVRHEHE
ncbi:tRNA (cytidine(32)/guanosine(34)-2'-O)-methyltransferase [Malassezia caprae]|uniref:tRNA (Cytidine(32)/guanosine(34)-2'-O)-methyltransferase n=1 Tax=Malassezia caprae TaxID=1381934 RepID=A0AAF0EBI2_9BASI|nr:tRNA (cytidine(32)/guanosine(34)-2'-O)-methyltransferase [Malassezia caprae]